MGYKAHPPSGPLLIGYDPEAELGEDHLARFIDAVVDAAPCPEAPTGPGQPGFHPRMLAKVSMYAYASGVHSSRRIEQNCHEHLAYMFLTREDRPCYHTISTARVEFKEYFESIWLHLLGSAAINGVTLLGRIAIDSTKFKANCSGDLIIEAEDYEAVMARLREHLEQAQKTDAREDAEGQSVKTQTGVSCKRLQMRVIIRNVGKPMPEGDTSARMVRHMGQALETLAHAKENGLKHVSLSDPDARMMPIGSSKAVGIGHMFEVAVDAGLVVAGGSCNSPTDTGHLKPLLEEARKHDPVPITGVTADSGYYQGGTVAELLDTGLDVVVPDSTTAGAMRRAEPTEDPIEFTKIEGRDAYGCPNGNVLVLKERWERGGQKFSQYKAKNPCAGCPLAERCLSKPDTKYRHVTIQERGLQLREYLDGFKKPDVRQKYLARGPAVETVFGLLRTTMSFNRWTVRGEKRVASEAELLKASYQARKIHKSLGGKQYKAA
jgi:transposase